MPLVRTVLMSDGHTKNGTIPSANLYLALFAIEGSPSIATADFRQGM